MGFITALTGHMMLVSSNPPKFPSLLFSPSDHHGIVVLQAVHTALSHSAQRDHSWLMFYFEHDAMHPNPGTQDSQERGSMSHVIHHSTHCCRSMVLILHNIILVHDQASRALSTNRSEALMRCPQHFTEKF